ncbi:unnamed protein product [Acanthosepion pharaonis]|uniref:Uncharacterized protein n=1 Tax=Acanthosepion pharaonis TaxID=158019 RepID=A0A812BY65_ACAPH|nr:unnamed protein product [Sepia pharaonis]
MSVRHLPHVFLIIVFTFFILHFLFLLLFCQRIPKESISRIPVGGTRLDSSYISIPGNLSTRMQRFCHVLSLNLLFLLLASSSFFLISRYFFLFYFSLSLSLRVHFPLSHNFATCLCFPFFLSFPFSISYFVPHFLFCSCFTVFLLSYSLYNLDFTFLSFILSLSPSLSLSIYISYSPYFSLCSLSILVHFLFVSFHLVIYSRLLPPFLFSLSLSLSISLLFPQYPVKFSLFLPSPLT